MFKLNYTEVILELDLLVTAAVTSNVCLEDLQEEIQSKS